MTSFSAKNRQSLIRQLTEGTFDVLVIGGGITGAGIALDATTRGLKVALIDMQDFAAGTSGRSTRLIHGGLRYLKQADFRLVAEVAKERAIIHRNAPHLVKPELLMLPITKSGTFGKFSTRAGMWLYEKLAGVKKEERFRFLNASESLRIEPRLKKENLLGAILYYEYRTDDARLTLSIIKEAVSRGALALSYLKVTGFDREAGRIHRVRVKDQLDNRCYSIQADHVINATGPWVDELDKLDDPVQNNKLQLTKGVHLVFDISKFCLHQGVYFDTHDKRMVFALPLGDKTYVGTTDTFYSGDIVNPQVTPEDKQYLLRCINGFFEGTSLQLSDIESCWAGIRPLIKHPGKKPSEISRRDEIFEWRSGLISIAGGKLTGYRKMAQRVVDLVAKKIEIPRQKKLQACNTENIFISGGKILFNSFSEFVKAKKSPLTQLGLSEHVAEVLAARYGSEIDMLTTMFIEIKNKEPHPDLPALLLAELHYAIEHEMCLTPSDFFIRRTGMLYFNPDEVVRQQKAILDHMANLFGWDEAEKQRHHNDLQLRLKEAGAGQ